MTGAGAATRSDGADASDDRVEAAVRVTITVGGRGESDQDEMVARDEQIHVDVGRRAAKAR